jgi:hypothetical protein
VAFGVVVISHARPGVPNEAKAFCWLGLHPKSREKPLPFQDLFFLDFHKKSSKNRLD